MQRPRQAGSRSKQQPTLYGLRPDPSAKLQRPPQLCSTNPRRGADQLTNFQATVTAKTGIQKLGNKVSNKLPQVKDPSINVRDRLNDGLQMAKYQLVGYQYGINEAIEDRKSTRLNSSHVRISYA